MATQPNVFGSVALSISRTPFDAQWKRVLSGGLGAGPWDQVVRAVRDQPRSIQIEKINEWVNARIEYAEDRNSEGVADRWATAGETLARGRGDCEDYAIVKHALLKRLGIPTDEMFLVIARDLVRRADHALLAVRVDDRLVILDAQTDWIKDSHDIKDYRPIMSYAANQSWIHGYRRAQDPSTTPSKPLISPTLASYSPAN